MQFDHLCEINKLQLVILKSEDYGFWDLSANDDDIRNMVWDGSW